MMKIQNARFARASDATGQRLGEVLVQLQGLDYQLLAMFARETKDFELKAVMKIDLDFELVFYDNNLHEAYEDVTLTLFNHPDWKRSGMSRDEFVQAVLSYGDIRKQLEEHLHPQAAVRA